MLCHASAGGSGVVASELGLAVARLGHQVHFVAQHIPFRLSSTPLTYCDSLFVHQVGSYTYPLFESPLTSLNLTNALADVIFEHDIDLTHAHYAIPHATSALMAKDITKRTKVITTLHGTDVTLLGLDPSFKHSTRYALERSDCCTAVSHYLANHTRESLKIEVPIQVIYNMVDTDRFKRNTDPQFRARFAHPDEFLIIHISNFRKVKRTADVIDTFAKISSEIPARLLMIGDGPERGPTFEQAQRLGVVGRTHFLGSFSNVESILGIGDLLLLPSEQESFGLVALEAMSCGVPVVGSNVGGIPEVVLDGKTGYLCGVGDTDQMADRGLQLLRNPQAFAAFSEAAQRQAHTFHADLILPQYLETYASLL